jgi:hypothetical protein
MHRRRFRPWLTALPLLAGHQINGTINVTNPDTVVLGLGIATLVSNGGNTILSTADVNGIRIAGLLFDAGTTDFAQLVQIGPAGSSASHASDPTVLSDVFARIGGATVGKAAQTLVVNSSNVTGDGLWLWRADHGNGGTVCRTTNTAANGMIVDGANATMYGLAVEHYRALQVHWNGSGGADYLYQSEMPYDPLNQSSWTAPRMATPRSTSPAASPRSRATASASTATSARTRVWSARTRSPRRPRRECSGMTWSRFRWAESE